MALLFTLAADRAFAQADLTGDRLGTPFEPRRGSAETMYPEYVAKMKTFKRPTGRVPGATESER